MLLYIDYGVLIAYQMKNLCSDLPVLAPGP